jgi:oxygen-independent coproporphyrinogen-3 oxidase
MTYSETPLLRYNQNVPRYTSYPTAPHFNSDITHKDYQEWLEAIPKNTNISLYIHIPFCPKLCWYCGCHTKATQRYTPIKNYLTYLKQEVAILATHLPHSTKLSHIHFGGGSPTILTPDDFDDLMQHIKSHFDTATNAEIAIELDPRGVSEEKVAAYKKHNVNRASIGVQDFDPDVQKAINRIQPFSSVYKAVQLLRTYGIDQINLDLMYGLPGQKYSKHRKKHRI